jgi:Na+-translocating ferredoxin:NAD+ oxidoreductase RnfD subunit
MAKRYQKGNRNQSIDEEHTIQWSKDTKRAIRISKSIYWFWLSLWYLLAIVFSVLRRFTDSDCPFGIFWPLYCVFFVDWLILISPLVSFGHCIVCSSLIYWFWLPLWYLLAIVLSVFRRFTYYDCPFDIFWDTKGAIRISKSTKNRQYNGQKIPKT